MNNILKSDLSWNGLISSFTDLLLFSYLDDINIYICVNLFICTMYYKLKCTNKIKNIKE